LVEKPRRAFAVDGASSRLEAPRLNDSGRRDRAQIVAIDLSEKVSQQ
jgi:hypothetical protein